jgi:uncharacterized protein
MRELLKTVGRQIGQHWVLAGFVIVAVGFVMTPHALERLFVYYPSRQLSADPGNVGLNFQDIAVVAEDNVKLHGWFVPSEGAKRTIMIFHGNGGNIGDRVPWVQLLHDLGVHVFIFDYRGYGKSEGKPFEEGLYRDARAVYDWWVRERRPRGEKLIIFGESLGGAVAVHLAARVPAAGLILQSTFTSARDMAKTMFPIGLLLPLTGVRFDSEKEIARVACPKLMIHGTRDEIVPFRLGKRLHDVAPHPKLFYAVPEAGHNDLVWVAGAEYSRQMRAFLSSIQE